MKTRDFVLQAAAVVLQSTGAESDCFRPTAVATWKFGQIAIDQCAEILLSGGSAVDAVEGGILAVELDTRDQYYVGVGGLPNSAGDMELDAAIMDGNLRYGAVLALKNITTPISVARTVMDRCVHSVLSGDGALLWAQECGFTKDSGVLTEPSKQEWLAWKQQQTQPEKLNVHNDSSGRSSLQIEVDNGHDTVGVICLDSEGHLCAGTSTSGWKFKHPGRVGDSPLIGSGLYCDGQVGAAVATGDGEEIMRCCLSFTVIELMRQGRTPQQACSEAIGRVAQLPSRFKLLPSAPTPSTFHNNSNLKMHTQLTVGVVAMDPSGRVGAASTLSELNPHRGRPGFPIVCWRGMSAVAGANAFSRVRNTKRDESNMSPIGPLNEPITTALSILEASEEGITF